MSSIKEKFYKLRLEKSLPIPLYYQIEKLIREMIGNKDLKPGDKIPTELELMNIFDVSRTTIRITVNNLLRDNFIEIIRSQGTFIKTKKFYEPLYGIVSFTEEVLEQGFTPSMKILDLNIIEPDKEVATIIKLKRSSEVYKIKRLRLLNGKTIGIDTTYLPANYVPNLKKTDFEEHGKKQSLYYLLEHKYKLVLDHSEEIITANFTTKKDRELLGLKSNIPIIFVHRIIFLPNNSPLLFIRLIYNCSFKASLKGRSTLQLSL